MLVIMFYEDCGVYQQRGRKDKVALIDKNIYDQIFEIEKGFLNFNRGPSMFSPYYLCNVMNFVKDAINLVG